MALVAVIPQEKEKLEHGIIAMEWQLEQPDVDEKIRLIYEDTLENYRNALNDCKD